ncbi:hypothetical protein, partial [Cardiobacterium valvarum]|uniref:hypothetical protein n=1 Tax=Cardiobacterium valvarum TaxID=194702 RepID=UPI001C11E5B1
QQQLHLHHEAESHHARNPAITPLAGRRASFRLPQQHCFIFIMRLNSIIRETRPSRRLTDVGRALARRADATCRHHSKRACPPFWRKTQLPHPNGLGLYPSCDSKKPDTTKPTLLKNNKTHRLAGPCVSKKLQKPHRKTCKAKTLSLICSPAKLWLWKIFFQLKFKKVHPV